MLSGAASVAEMDAGMLPACARRRDDFRRSVGGIPGTAAAAPRLHAGECLASSPIDQLLIGSESWRAANESGFDVDVPFYRCSSGFGSQWWKTF